jgi:hypothetical protein
MTEETLMFDKRGKLIDKQPFDVAGRQKSRPLAR